MNDLIEQPWRCLKTGNPVGTDTEMVGHTCACQVCRAAATIARLERDVEFWRADALNSRSRLLTIKNETVEECAKEGEGAVRQLWGGEPCDPDEYADFVGNAILSLATPSGDSNG